METLLIRIVASRLGQIGLAKRIRWCFLIGFSLALYSGPAASGEISAEKLTPRPGVTERVLFIKPDGPPKASVVLFASGKGKIGVRKDGTIKNAGNFLVKTRKLFASHGLLVAVFDAPSDQKGSDGMSGYRITEDHAADVAAVVKRLRELATVPIWLIGTSRGTISAANAAARLPPPVGPDGIVLTSTVVETGNRGQDSIHKTALERIKVPTLVFHHKKDGCYVTLWSEAKDLAKKLTAAPKVETIGVTGGESGDVDKECKNGSHHGFKGIREEVVKQIADWIKAN